MRRQICLALTAAVCLAVTACQTTSFELPPTVPEDFRLHLIANDGADPDVDYALLFDRSGKVAYTVTLRGDEPRAVEGEFEVQEGDIQSLYDAVLAAGFDRLAATYSASPPIEAVGMRTFYVRVNDQERAVQVDRARPADIARLQTAVLAVVPSWVLRGDGAPASASEPMDIVAVRSTHLFHRPECEHAAAAGDADRVAYSSQFDALNFGFDPCPSCSPIGRR